MKKGLFLLIFVLAFSVSLFAQNTNIETRIIGTWIDHEGDTWVFSANGNVLIDRYNNKFGITNNKLAVLESDESFTIFDISISSEGRTLILDISYTSKNSMFNNG
jgi:hypothetical protein